MTNRLALVIGVRDYKQPRFQALPVVEHDMEAMQSCLATSGYEVKPFGLDTGERAGSTIYQQVRNFCREAPQGSTLIVYFSGHGLHYRGKDYLVPADFDPMNAGEADRLLVPIDITDAVEDSRAQAVFVFVDACRTGVDLDNLDVKTSVFGVWGRTKVARVSGRRFAIVYGCSPGQFCQYVSGDEPFSLFTTALVSALSPEHPATSLTQVIDAAQKELDRLVALHGKSTQQIRVLSEHSAGEPGCGEVIICDAKNPGIIGRGEADVWKASVSGSPLWIGIKDGPGGLSEKLKQRVLAIVAACRVQFNQGREVEIDEPWLDEALPCRVLDRLGFLIEQSDPRIEVSGSERALLLIAPFLREAILSHGRRLAAAAGPFDPDPIPPQEWEEPFRGKLEQIFQSSPQLVRRAKRMLELNRTGDQKAILKWLVHRAVLRDPELWLVAPNGLLPENFLRSLELEATATFDMRDPEEIALAQSLDPSLVLELAKCVCCDPGRLDRNDTSQSLHLILQLSAATPFEQTIRARALGYLLSLAGWLAIDPRLFSDVVVDHVGLSNPFPPSELLRYVRLASWHAVGRARSLHLTCEHPAADLAFREYTSRAANVLASCHRAASEYGQALSILCSLPTRLSADGVIPAERHGVPTYQLPHLRFELAQDEVRELLMGEQLYGSPVYAIRELYQNALDALRYRQSRLKYLQCIKGVSSSWEGRIVFRQDVATDGREFIECEDNGIGMGHRELSECFARAGKRFSTLPEFIEERSQWLRCDPPIHLYPNSQFGIGVFSYFMLADEIEIETCRLDRDGRPAQKLGVGVSSGGSLFRVRSLGPGEDSGTRIRLFLSKKSYNSRGSDWGQRISCTVTLAKLVGVAEFPLLVYEHGTQHGFTPRKFNTGVADPWERAQISGHPDLLWSTAGLVLADGTAVRDVDKFVHYHLNWQLPLIVNFHGPQYPRLSVNRTELLSYDDEWLDSLLDQHWKSATSIPFLSLEWLLNLNKYKPRVTRKIVESLWETNVALPVRKDGKNSRPLQEIGWWQGDLELFRFTGRLNDDDIGTLGNLEPRWWIPYRLRFLEKIGVDLNPEVWEHVGSLGPAGAVIPAPGDELVLIGALYAYGDRGRVSVDPFQLACWSAKINVPVGELLARIARYSVLGIELPPPNVCDVIRSVSLSKLDLRLLSCDTVHYFSESEGLRYLARSREDFSPKFSGVRLVLASAELKESLRALSDRLNRMAALGVEIPKFDVGILGAIIPTSAEARVVGEVAWHGCNIAAVAREAIRSELPLAEVHRIYTRFVPLVSPLPDWDLNSLRRVVPGSHDALLLSKHLDLGLGPVSEVTVAHVSAAQEKLQISAEAVIKALRKYQPFGLTFSADISAKHRAKKKTRKSRR